MLKYVFLFLVVITCIFIGYSFSRKYKIRSNFFKAIIYICRKFDIEINYSRERLKDIFSHIDESYKKHLYGIDNNFLQYLNKKSDLTEKLLFNNINYLKENEKDLIYNFFKMLGRSDVESQSKEINNFLIRFEDISNKASEENHRYGMMSLKLGIICGILLFIILI